MPPPSLDHLLKCLGTCIEQNNLNRLKQLLESSTQDDKTFLMFHEGSPILRNAAGIESPRILEYIMDNYEADVNLPYCLHWDVDDMECGNSVPSTNREIRETPLLHAIEKNRIENIRVLIKHGVDVNASFDRFGDPLHPPLFIAFANNPFNKDIVDLLLENGASVNLRTADGLTALHAAVRQDNFDCIKLFLEKGAEYCWDDTVCILPWAAFCDTYTGNKGEIVQYLTKNLEHPDDVIADMLEVQGANAYFSSDSKHHSCTIEKWKEAMKIRHKNENSPFLKNLPADRHKIFQNEKEPQTIEELDRVLLDHKTWMGQALLIYQRVLRENNPEFTHLLEDMLCVFEYESFPTMEEKEERLTYLDYFMSLSLKHANLTSNLTLLTWFMMNLFLDRGHISTRRVLNLLKIISTALTPGNAISERLKSKRHSLMVNFVLYLGFLRWLLNDGPIDTHYDKELEDHNLRLSMMSEVRELCIVLARINPVDKKNRSILHLALYSDNGIGDEETDHAISLPSVELTDLLLSCGFDINWRDSDGNTPLMTVFLNGAISEFQVYYCDGKRDVWEDKRKSIVNTLLKAEPHEDVRNIEGKTYRDILPADLVGRTVTPRLQCLAARAIADSGVAYEDVAPKNMIPFISMHHKQTNKQGSK